MIFTTYYAEQSCTAGRSTFITGQRTNRPGLTKAGLPGADLGLRAEDPTIAELLKPHAYANGQFGKNHLGDKDEFLRTNHWYDAKRPSRTPRAVNVCRVVAPDEFALVSCRAVAVARQSLELESGRNRSPNKCARSLPLTPSLWHN